MTAIPDVYDYLTARWKLISNQAGLEASQILDGPAVEFAGSEGVAVGTTATDTTAEVTYAPGSLSGSAAEDTSFPVLIWSGSGDVTFTGRRARVKAIYNALLADIARDRTLGGTVGDTWITGGVYDQQQLNGALVMFEFRIQFRRF